jgi:glucose-6-phosphate 1-dehydrogenase
MEIDITTLLSPAAIGGLFWFFVRKYFSRQEEILQKLSNAMSDVQMKMAIHESKAMQIEKIIADFDRIREEHTLQKSKVEAAWRLLDRLQDADKSQSDEIDRIKDRISQFSL